MNLLGATTAITKASAPASKTFWYTVAHYNGLALTATNGMIWATAPVDLGIPPCVVGLDALHRTALRDVASLEYNDAKLIVKIRPRSRITLNAGNDDQYPRPPHVDYDWKPLQPGIKNVLASLIHFTDDANWSPWVSAVHVGVDLTLATDRAEMAVAAWGTNNTVPGYSIGPAACAFIMAQEDEPSRVHVDDRGVSFEWTNGLNLRARYIDDIAPDAVWTMASSLPAVASQVVPEGLVDAVDNFVKIGVKIFTVMPDHVSADFDNGNVREEIALGWPSSLWDCRRAQRMLKYATHIERGNDGFIRWSGPGLRGVLAGRR